MFVFHCPGAYAHTHAITATYLHFLVYFRPENNRERVQRKGPSIITAATQLITTNRMYACEVVLNGVLRLLLEVGPVVSEKNKNH